MKRHQLEQYLYEVITKKKRGFGTTLLRFFLLFLSWPFQFCVLIRNWSFDCGLLRRYSPPIPVVVSIGNIVAGGTGKTPVTMLLAQEFYEKYPLAILARGYRSKSERLATPTILSHGAGPKSSAEFCGDEPFLIASHFPKAFVVVGRNRQKASDIAVKFGTRLLLLDDGMQHRRLARDFEIVVMDALDLFGQGYFLPRGLLRESARSLKRAHLILLNHVQNQQLFEEACQKLSKYVAVPIIGVCTEVSHIQQFKGSQKVNVESEDPGFKEQVSSLADQKLLSIQGIKVGLLSGIAKPEYFYRTVTSHGALVVDHAIAPDHCYHDRKSMSRFAESCQAAGAELLLCTEKDRVKLLDCEPLALPLASVKTVLSIVAGKEKWRQFLEQIDLRLAQYQ